MTGTGKPQGVMEARRLMGELVEKEKEIAKEEKNFTAILETFTQKQQLVRTVLVESARRTKALQEDVNDRMMRTDTTGMDLDTKSYIETRQRHILEDLRALDAQMELERKAAAVAATAAPLAEAAASAAATVAAALGVTDM